MNIPAIVTNQALEKLASPGETHEVHVIVRRMVNLAPYTLRGRKRQYVVARCNKRNAHILKVPLSVWMHGCDPTKPVTENDSIAYDLQATRTALKSPLTFEIVAIRPVPESSAAIKIPPQFRELLDKLDAPEEVLHGLDLLEAGDLDALEKFADSLNLEPQGINIATTPTTKPEVPKPTEPGPLTNAQRQAAHRARKKAEKEAAEASQLQPA